jgi:HEAT repeat protein
VHIRSSAVNILAKIGPSSIPAIIPLLRNDDAYTQSSAVDTIGNMGESAKSAIPALIPLLKSRHSYVRSRASYALKRLGYKP